MWHIGSMNMVKERKETPLFQVQMKEGNIGFMEQEKSPRIFPSVWDLYYKGALTG